MIRPIDTPYRGYLFRSRLEARWAVFFDALGLRWGYEVEGYELEGGTMYLPDFWLPDVMMWAEVKPHRMTEGEIEKCRRLVKGTGYSCVLLEGQPDNRAYPAIENLGDGEIFRLDHCLTCEDDYPFSENRFYGCPGCNCADLRLPGGCTSCQRDDTSRAVAAALSARFEHGESDDRLPHPVSAPAVPRVVPDEPDEFDMPVRPAIPRPQVETNVLGIPALKRRRQTT